MRSFSSLVLVLAFAAASQATVQLPTLSLSEMKSAISSGNLDALRDDGGKFSAFVLTEVNEQDAIESLFMSAPDCLKKISDTQTLELANGAVRTTFATEENVYPACAEDALKELDQGFSRAEILVTRFIEAVAGKTMYYNVGESRFPLSNAPKKDHVHVYSAPRHALKGDKDFLVPRHVDSGMFLLINPFPGHGLDITTSSGAIISTSDVDATSIIVLFGLATPDWLLQGQAAIWTQFHAAPHSVPAMIAGSPDRTVFARMKVAPSDAVPVGGRWTFSDVFLRKDDYTREAGDGRLCSVSVKDADLLRWMSKDDYNCPDGTAYCWMDCLDLPDECPLEEDAICKDDTGRECAPDDMVGSCAWECLPTTVNPTTVGFSPTP